MSRNRNRTAVPQPAAAAPAVTSAAPAAVTTARPAPKAPAARKVSHHYVYSTISNDTVYGGQRVARRGEAAMPTWRVLINGGANVLSKRLQTARGVATKVTRDELDLLLQDTAFKRHMERGFITHSPVYENPDEVASEMEAKDKSAQKTANDFSQDNKPKTGLAAAEKLHGSNSPA